MRDVVAKNYLCFLALLEMIIEDTIGATFINQDYLAEYFGITVPYDYKISIKNVHYSNIDREFGVHIDENILNNFFVNVGIPMRANYITVNEFEENEIDDINCDFLRKGKYIVYTFSYGALYREKDTYGFGHVVLLDKVISEDSLQVYDPGPRDCGHKIVNRHTMYDAMRYVRGGIYVFSKV